MEILLNPNIAYLVLAFGLVVTVLAILSPGTGVLEIGALLVLGLVAWMVYNLSFNWWALITLVLGMLFFTLAVRWPRQRTYLVIAIAAIVVGSAYLFPGEEWWMPAVNPFLAIIVSLLMGGFFWVAAQKILEARQAPPHLDLNQVVGEDGEAKTDIQQEGTVLIGSELWSARSAEEAQLIPRGARVKVIAREGFILTVAPLEENQAPEEALP